MKRINSSELNELMIVNPGRPGSEETLSIGQVFLADDGTTYQLRGFNRGQGVINSSQYLLGEDGALYQIIG